VYIALYMCKHVGNTCCTNIHSSKLWLLIILPVLAQNLFLSATSWNPSVTQKVPNSCSYSLETAWKCNKRTPPGLSETGFQLD